MNRREKRKLFGMFNSQADPETIPVHQSDETSEDTSQDNQETTPMMSDEENLSESDDAVMDEPEATEDTDGQLAVDMYQTKDAYVIKSTIAGVRPEDIDVTVNDNVLTVTGERMMQEEVRDKDYFLQECYWGEFSRSVELPDDFDGENINAEIKDGILTITVPKSERSKPKKIQVRG